MNEQLAANLKGIGIEFQQFRDSFYVTLFLCLITTLVVYWSIYGFGTFDQTKEVEVLSKPYLTLLMWSLAPMLLFFYSKNICDGYGYTRGGMVITVLALLLNIFLNWVFIYGNLGFSAYGLNGAGYATIISRIFLAAAMFTVLFKSKQTPISFAEWRHSFTNYKQFRFFGQCHGYHYSLSLAATKFVRIASCYSFYIC